MKCRANELSVKTSITKYMVWEAYKKVKRNKGSGGVDKISLQDYEKSLQGNLYKLWNRLASGSYYKSKAPDLFVHWKYGFINA